MTTAAEDTADEAAFEAFLAGRPVSEEAADLAVFAGAVRATATVPGRPNAALAELLSTGLLTDQSSPSTRTAPSAGSPPRRSRVRIRRRFAMIFPALLAKLLSAGAVAQAATGAGVVLVVATGAGATGVLGADVQDTITSVVGADPDEISQQDPALTGDETATDPGEVGSTDGDTAVPVEPVQETFDAEKWADGPDGTETFGEWVSRGAHNKDALAADAALRGVDEWKNFGAMVSYWAHEKHMSAEDLAEEGVDLDELTEEPVTEQAAGVDDSADDSDAATTQHGNGNGRGNGGGNSNGGNSRGHN